MDENKKDDVVVTDNTSVVEPTAAPEEETAQEGTETASAEAATE